MYMDLRFLSYLQSVKCILDITAPTFPASVSISITSDNKYLVASWPTAFSDSEDPFELDIKFALGMTDL